jgi:hypothetical protein
MDTWAYVPDRDFSYSLEWYTSVTRTVTKEYRASMRTRPRVEITYQFKLTPEQYGAAKLLARKQGAAKFRIPLWQEGYRVANLAFDSTAIPKDQYNPFHTAGGLVLVWESDTKWEVATIASVNPYTQINLTSGLRYPYTNALIVPIRVADFVQQLSAPREASESRVTASARFRIIEGDDFSTRTSGLYLSSPKYRNLYVVRDRALVSGSIRDQSHIETKELDTEVGGLSVTQIHTSPEERSSMAWGARTNAARWNLLYWLHTRRGRFKSFWCPSWNSDLELRNTINPADTSITVLGAEVPSATFPIDLFLLKRNGESYCFRVTGATYTGGGLEVLTLDEAIGVTINTWEVEAICFLRRVRFDADHIELRHTSNNQVYVTAPIVEVPL